MKYQVISAFIDKRDGRQIDPGQPVPEGLDRDTIERLVLARCLRPLEPEQAPVKQPSRADGDARSNPSGEALPTLFPAGGAEQPSEGDNEPQASAADGGDAVTSQPTVASNGRRGRRAPDASSTQ